MEEMHRERYEGESSMHHSPQIATCLLIHRLAEPSSLGFLWGIHYIE